MYASCLLVIPTILLPICLSIVSVKDGHVSDEAHKEKAFNRSARKVVDRGKLRLRKLLPSLNYCGVGFCGRGHCKGNVSSRRP